MYEWAKCESTKLFLYDFELKEGGCRILCVYLNSSSDSMHHGQYLDSTFTKSYNLEDSEDCKKSKTSQVCVQILTASFRTQLNKPLSFNITFNDKFFIATANSSKFNRASYKQEFCFPTDDLQADHQIKITPVKSNDTEYERPPEIAREPGDRTHVISLDPHSVTEETDDPDSDYPTSNDTNPAVYLDVTHIGRGLNVPMRPNEKNPGRLPFPGAFPASAPAGPPPGIPASVVIHTKSLMQNSENATITTHDMGNAILDVIVTLKKKN
jgi:hypothetical protein